MIETYSAKERIRAFTEKVDEQGADECWEWLGARRRGYGVFRSDSVVVSAHRYMWTAFNGPVPEGMKVLHKCNNSGCVNPHHLYLGTSKDNMEDMVKAGNSTRSLTNDQVTSMRRDYASGKFIYEELGKKYGVDRRIISPIILRRTYKEV